MTSVIGTLRANSRMFPNFARFVLIAYIVVGLAIVLGVAAATHNFVYGIVAAAAVILLDVVGSVVAYKVIASKPTLFARCRAAADALVNYRTAEPEAHTPSYDEPNDEEDENEEPEEEDGEEEEPEQETSYEPCCNKENNEGTEHWFCVLPPNHEGDCSPFVREEQHNFPQRDEEQPQPEEKVDTATDQTQNPKPGTPIV